jgi:sulfoxide reductase heme-binding subunit YedZ
VLVLVALAGAGRGRLAAENRAHRHWRSVHRLAYAGWALIVAHGLLAGTDAASGWLLAVTGGSVLVVLGCAAIRLVARSDERRRRLTTTRSRARSLASVRSSS